MCRQTQKIRQGGEGSDCLHSGVYQAGGAYRPADKHGINPGVRGGSALSRRGFSTQPSSALNTYLHRSACGLRGRCEAAGLLIHILALLVCHRNTLCKNSSRCSTCDSGAELGWAHCGRSAGSPSPVRRVTDTSQQSCLFWLCWSLLGWAWRVVGCSRLSKG